MVISFSNVYAQNSVLNKNENVTLYPNPATSQLNLIFNQPNRVISIVVYSLIGNEVLNRKIENSTNYRFNIQNLKKGKYILRAFKEDGSSESISFIKI